MHFLHFTWPINYNQTSQCTKSFTHPSPSWFWSNFLYFPWIHGVMYDHVLWASSCISEWRTHRESSLNLILIQHPNDEDLNCKRCPLVLKLNPLELGIIAFFWTFVPWWFSYKLTLLLVMNLKLFVKVFTKLKTGCMVFNSQRWTLLLVALSDSSTPS